MRNVRPAVIYLALFVGFFANVWIREGRIDEYSAPAVGRFMAEPTLPEKGSSQKEPPQVTEIAPSVEWRIEVDDLGNLRAALEKERLIYAVKAGRDVSVYERNVRTGTERDLFTYREYATAEKGSGNFWMAQAASIALSPDGNSIAYAAEDGLFIRNIETGSIALVIEGTRVTAQGEEPQRKWSFDDPSAGQTYNLALPEWSSRGGFIGFSQSHYEGMTKGLMESSTRKYRRTPAMGNLAWTDDERAYVQTSGIRAAGLWYVTMSPYAETNIGERFAKPAMYFEEADLSADGTRIATIFQPEWTSSGMKLGVVDMTGRNLRVVADGSLQMPVFVEDDAVLLYVRRIGERAFLYRYDREKDIAEAVGELPPGFTQWKKVAVTEEGYVAMAGIAKDGSPKAGDRMMLVLDVVDRNIVYAHHVPSAVTAYAGFR